LDQAAGPIGQQAQRPKTLDGIDLSISDHLLLPKLFL
jgi:hypothetical protein